MKQKSSESYEFRAGIVELGLFLPAFLTDKDKGSSEILFIRVELMNNYLNISSWSSDLEVLLGTVDSERLNTLRHDLLATGKNWDIHQEKEKRSFN